MSFFLFPNFYADALCHAVTEFALTLKWMLWIAHINAKIAFWTRLGVRFENFSRGK